MRRRTRIRPTSWVYFAQVGPYLKVGYSTNPQRRVQRLFSSATTAPADAPRGLGDRRLLRVIPGGRGDERAVHAALDDFRVEREWFLGEPAVMEFVADVEPGHYPRVTRAGGSFLADAQAAVPAEDVLAASLVVFTAPTGTRRRRRRAS